MKTDNAKTYGFTVSIKGSREHIIEATKDSDISGCRVRIGDPNKRDAIQTSGRGSQDGIEWTETCAFLVQKFPTLGICLEMYGDNEDRHFCIFKGEQYIDAELEVPEEFGFEWQKGEWPDCQHPALK